MSMLTPVAPITHITAMLRDVPLFGLMVKPAGHMTVDVQVGMQTCVRQVSGAVDRLLQSGVGPCDGREDRAE